VIDGIAVEQARHSVDLVQRPDLESVILGLYAAYRSTDGDLPIGGYCRDHDDGSVGIERVNQFAAVRVP
jgi:hypothetical protein